jgi:PPOX class probable F420-dependent enzyme
MAKLTDPEIRALLEAPNHAIISTQNGDGSILSTVVWVDYVDGVLAVNSAVGRRWPANLERDPHITLVVMDPSNPYLFVEVRGRVKSTLDGADQHIDALAKKFIGKDVYPFRAPGERRIKFVVEPDRVRLNQQ